VVDNDLDDDRGHVYKNSAGTVHGRDVTFTTASTSPVFTG
jgi:hypothetical protein